MGIEVKNVRNTTGLKCSCDSWLAHWENFAGRSASYCSGAGCTAQSDLVGGHVKRTTERSWFIVPLCKTHNAIDSDSEYEVEDYTRFAPANVAKTCG